VAFVQASGPDYPDALARALAYPAADDLDGDELSVSSGLIAIFSSALDGAGPRSQPLVTARPGPVPDDDELPPGENDPGLLISAVAARYTLKVRWYTRLDEDSCFARWLLIPGQGSPIAGLPARP
jgi:hypothetical protein